MVFLKDTQTEKERSTDTDGVFIFVGFKPNSQIVSAGIILSLHQIDGRVGK